jgi:DNA-binding response OmpR family regulator
MITKPTRPTEIFSTKIYVIEPSGEMQRLLRGMFMNCGMREVRMFNDSARAVNAILSDPPHLVVMEWMVEPYDGANFLKLFRHQNMFPVCLMPIVVTFAEPYQLQIERALKLGAHAVVAKPLSASVLMDRINWVLDGNQEMRLCGERYIVEGVQNRLDNERERQSQFETARQYQESQLSEMRSIQTNVDRILGTKLG